MSNASGGEGWWLASDGKWYPPQPSPPPPEAPRRGGPSRGVLVLIGVIAFLVVAGGTTAAVLVANRGSTAQPALEKPLSAPTTTSSNPQVAANEVESCMQTHSMTYANEVTKNFTASVPPFLQKNGNPFSGSADPEYSSQSPTVVEFQSCVWPPPSWADQTGYSQILMTSAPGDTAWPGEISPYGDADVVDSTCGSVEAQYSGEHTGTSFSNTATVNQGGIVVAGGEGTGFGPPPGSSGSTPSLSGWGQALGFAIQPGESVVLHLDAESVISAQCVG